MKKFFRLGISDQYPAYKNNAISASNVVALFIFLFAFIFGVILHFHAPKINYVTLFLLIAIVFSVYANSRGLVDTGRVILALSLALSISLYNALPLRPEEPLYSHFYLLQIALLLLPWAIADLRERSVIGISLLGALFFVLFQPMMRDSFTIEMETAELTAPEVVYAIHIISITSIILLLLILKFRQVRYDERKAKVNEEIEAKEAEMSGKQSELRKQIEEINVAHENQEQRSWVAQNLTQVTDILRTTAHKDDNIYPELVEEITKILDAVQVAIYIMDDEDSRQRSLILKGLFAFDRIKYQEQEIAFGDGLIGQSCIDREPIYLDNLPNGYLNIDSGLGGESPKNLAIVPLIDEEELTGVFEILSRNKFSPREKEFLSQLSKSVASFVNTNKINIKINELIEQNQSQAEEMRAQEEEMLQNMEELQATQEEMTRKEKEYQERIKELEEKLVDKN